MSEEKPKMTESKPGGDGDGHGTQDKYELLAALEKMRSGLTGTKDIGKGPERVGECMCRRQWVFVANMMDGEDVERMWDGMGDSPRIPRMENTTSSSTGSPSTIIDVGDGARRSAEVSIAMRRARLITRLQAYINTALPAGILSVATQPVFLQAPKTAVGDTPADQMLCEDELVSKHSTDQREGLHRMIKFYSLGWKPLVCEADFGQARYRVHMVQLCRLSIYMKADTGYKVQYSGPGNRPEMQRKLQRLRLFS
ncbi:hypothetical protein B0H17DRAFT_1146870 [Mycena rosella]|uniref:Uncharacterized protein n=1 Tax=Mycena rosella TaxID=1033263 RepID=A0AAD7CMW1_MYCRO|nr:hypothetical protein B0H17DRAFT_1146870 [Mycena rosella]